MEIDAADGDRHERGKIGPDGIEWEIDVGLGAVERPALRPSEGGAAPGSSGRTAATRAATRAFSSSVSPGRSTKVPVDWSLAILAASASMLPVVSIR